MKTIWDAMSKDARRLNPHLDPSRNAAKFDAALAEKSAPKREKDLQNQLFSLLYRRGHRPRLQRTDRKSNLALGMPDISFEIGGRSVHWEVKLPGKDPEPHQARMLADLAAPPNGAIVRVIRSLREGLDHLQSLEAEFRKEAA